MCGIVAAFSKKANVNNEVLLQFEDQSSRGTNGFGSIFLDEDGEFSLDRSTGQIKAIIDIKLKESKQIIFHHRTPSSSKNKISQTHPILIKSGDLKHQYFIVHNGVIYNSDERKKYHEDELGYVYSTHAEEKAWGDTKEWMYNDSETLGYDIARFIEGQTTKIKSAGSAAFILARVSRKTGKINRVYYGRNTGNPLMLKSNGKTKLSLSSEGKGSMVKEDKLYSFALKDYKVTKKKMSVPTSIPMTKVEEEEAKTEENKSKGVAVSYNPATPNKVTYAPAPSYYEDKWKDYDQPARGYVDDMMDPDDAAEVETEMDAARTEIESLSDEILDSYNGQELYLVDVEGTVRRIAQSLAKAVQIAQEAKTRAYFDEEDEALAMLEDEKKAESKTLVI